MGGRAITSAITQRKDIGKCFNINRMHDEGVEPRFFSALDSLGFIKLRKQFHRFAVITVIIGFWRLWRPSVPVPTPYRLWHVAQLKVFT
jgi:hypothetical protein